MADVAFAAGFSSVRTFNETVQEVFALSPTELRSRARRGTATSAPGTISLRLPFRAPLTPDNLFGQVRRRIVPADKCWFAVRIDGIRLREKSCRQ